MLKVNIKHCTQMILKMQVCRYELLSTTIENVKVLYACKNVQKQILLISAFKIRKLEKG